MLMSFLVSSRRRHTRCSGVSWVQAEDGIRDAQESRGLGDVYKRQGIRGLPRRAPGWERPPCASAGPDPVSYTHLRAHETPEHLVCRLLLEKKKKHAKHG